MHIISAHEPAERVAPPESAWPEALRIDPDDARKLGVRNGDKLQIESRRGKIALRVWVTDRAQPGMVFVPFFDENALINVLTVDDPKSLSAAGQPDYKICAVRLKKA